MKMNKQIQYISFGVCLLELRHRRHISQKAVASLAGMDQSYLAGLETERRPPPKEKQLARIILALQATSEEEQQLREAHTFSTLIKAAEALNPECGKPLIVIATYFRRLTHDDLKIIKNMASTLIHRIPKPETKGISMR